MKFSKPGLILSLAYLTIFVFSGIHMIYLLVSQTTSSEFSGLLPFLMTLPWSTIMISVLDSLGYIAWSDYFANSPIFYGFFALLPFLLSALINAVILYFIGKFLGYLVNKSKNRKENV